MVVNIFSVMRAKTAAGLLDHFLTTATILTPIFKIDKTPVNDGHILAVLEPIL